MKILTTTRALFIMPPLDIGEKDMLYYIAGFSVRREKDHFKKGCIPETAQMDIDDTRLQASTQKGLVGEITGHFEVDYTYITLNACGDVGRVDIQRHELENGDKPNDVALEKWRAGELRLYLATYTGYLEVKRFGPKWRKLKDCNYD